MAFDPSHFFTSIPDPVNAQAGSQVRAFLYNGQAVDEMHKHIVAAVKDAVEFNAPISWETPTGKRGQDHCTLGGLLRKC